jgi:hypothetical protein
VLPDHKAMIDQQLRISAVRKKIMDAMSASEERDVSIWIAALAETMNRVSDWNLELERKQTAQ